jgi:hypothetical protein
MKSAISTVLVSLLITVIISIGFGFALSNFLGFLQGTTLVFLLQIILFYVYSLIRQNNISRIEEEHISVINEIAERSLVRVECPCGVKNDSIPYFDVTDAIFTCEKCSSKYRVEVVFNSILLTEPLNLENAFTKIKEKELR